MNALLRRHDLVRLTRAAWVRLATMHPERRALLERWAANDRPLVVTRQRAPRRDDRWAVGLPAPLADDRARVALEVSTAEVASRDAFPRAGAVGTLPAVLRDAFDGARVYGAHGWQAITGEAYVHARSDIDLLVDVAGDADADDTAARLVALGTVLPLDGELVFDDGRAVAWREWHAWRAGRTDRILVKRLDGVVLEAGIRA